MLLFLIRSLGITPLALPVPTALLAETKFVRSFVVVRLLDQDQTGLTFGCQSFFGRRAGARAPVDQLSPSAPVAPPAGRLGKTCQTVANKISLFSKVQD